MVFNIFEQVVHNLQSRLFYPIEPEPEGASRTDQVEKNGLCFEIAFDLRIAGRESEFTREDRK